VRIAALEGAQQLGNVGHQPHRISTSRRARQRVAGLKLRSMRSWAMRSCSCPLSRLLVREKGYTRKRSTRSSDDGPTRDRCCHHCEMAVHRPRAATLASFNSG
jgi:hypothetical protein